MNDVDKKLLSSDNELNKQNETTAFLNTIKDAIAVGSWEVHLHTMQVWWSSMTKKIHEVELDYSPTFNGGFEFFANLKDRELLKDVFNKAINKGETYDVELQLKTAKNNKKWVRIIGYPVFKNKVCIKIIGVFQDITIKTNIINESILKEKQIRTTLEYSPNGMAIVDLNDNILSVNKRLCDFLGYSKKELLSIKYSALTHSSNNSKTKSQVTKMLNEELSNFQIEKRYIHKSGKKVYGLLSTSLIRDEKNYPLYFIKNIIDIDPAKKEENKFQKLLKKAEDQNLKLLNLAHIVSHNLRSHSGNLKILLELMQEDIPSTTNNEYFQYLEQAVNNLAETIDNLNEVLITNFKRGKKLESNNLLELTNKF